MKRRQVRCHAIDDDLTGTHRLQRLLQLRLLLRFPGLHAIAAVVRDAIDEADNAMHCYVVTKQTPRLEHASGAFFSQKAVLPPAAAAAAATAAAFWPAAAAAAAAAAAVPSLSVERRRSLMIL